MMRFPLTITALDTMNGQPVWWWNEDSTCHPKCTLCMIDRSRKKEPRFVSYDFADKNTVAVLTLSEIKKMGYIPYKTNPLGRRTEQNCKIFVSTPMAGKSKEEIKERLKQAAAEATKILLEGGYIEQGDTTEVIGSYIERKREPLEYLAASLSMMADADVIVFDKGYSENRGCLCEEYAAFKYGLFCIHLDDTRKRAN